MNPISSVVQGAYKAAEGGVKSTAKKAVSNAIPSPSEAVYNLGMGIGPMLRSIADEMKRGKQQDSKEAAKKDSQLIGRKDLAVISSQFNTMITVLKDLKTIGMMQLKREQQLALESRRQSFFDKEAALEGGMMKPQLGSSQSGGGADGAKTAFGGALGAIMGMFTPGKLIAMGGLAAIWSYILDDENKKMIKDQAGNLVRGMMSTAADAWVGAFKDDPKTTAAITGIVGLMVANALRKSAIYKFGAGIATAANSVKLGDMFKSATPAATTVATNVAKTAPAVTAATTARAMTPAELSRASEGIAQKGALAATSKAEAAAKGAQAAQVASAAEAAKATSMLGKTAALASKALGTLGAGYTAYSAYNEFKEGKNITGTLSALSAATGAFALAAGATGVGVPLAAAAGGLSALLGVGSVISGALEKPTDRSATGDGSQPALQGQPTLAASGSGGFQSAGPLENVKGVIYHHTGGETLDGALATLKEKGLSYNYIIDKNGKVIQLLDDKRAANHGGKMGNGLTNRNTVGVSFVAKDDASVTKQQLEAAKILHKQLAEKYGFNPDAAYGHGQVSPDRKQATEGLTAVNVVKGGSIPSNVQTYAGGDTGDLSMSSASSITPSNISGDRANDSNKVSDPTMDFIEQLTKLMTTGSANIINIDQSKKSSSVGGTGVPSFNGGVNDSNIRSAVSSVALPA